MLGFYSKLTLSIGIFCGYCLLLCYYYDDGAKRNYYLIYFAPVIFPASFFIMDCVEDSRRKTLFLFDSFVMLLATVRAFYAIPFYSGHALFLCYVVIVSHSNITKFFAAVVLLETVFFKLIVWNHDKTLYGGIIIAFFLAYIRRTHLRTT